MTARSSGRGRLSRSAEFERVYRHGRSTANRHLVLYSFPNPSTRVPRLGVSVSRRVGGAVQRNRVAEHAGLAGVEASLSELIMKVNSPAGQPAQEDEGQLALDADAPAGVERAR
jgi:hypothetical protein